MTYQARIATDGTTTGLGSIQSSLAYLERQAWWPLFRESRGRCVQQIDDVLWVGHFCAWLQRRRLALENCTKTDVDAYLASIASFRPGPRAACERTVVALIDFLATGMRNTPR